MSATIRIGIIEATIDGYKWTSKSESLKDMLNALLDPDGLSGSDPNPDETAAIEAVELIGGEVVRATPADFNARTIY